MLTVLIITCLVAFLVSSLCSLTEAVLLTLNPLRLKAQFRRGQLDAAAWLEWKSNIERPVATILVFNTLANTGLATLAGGMFIAIYGSHWLWAFSLGCTLVVLLGTELLPKVLGVNHVERLAPILAPVLRTAQFLLRPLTAIFERLMRAFRPGTSPDRDSHIMDIITLTQAAQAERVIHSHEEMIIIHAATLSARRVSSIMVPREAIRFLHTDTTFDGCLDAAGTTLHTRYPVSSTDSPDDICGYVNVKDIVASTRSRESGSIREFIRPTFFVTENASLTALLALFFEKKEKFAIVRGTSGQVAGLVARHDIVQLLVGGKL